MTREYLDTMKVPTPVAEQAKVLGVSAEALRDMYGAELLLHYAGQSPGGGDMRRAADSALALLASRGDEGFLAVAANARGNPSNTSRVDAMAKATWRPGLERHLLEWMQGAAPDAPVTAVLRALGGIDSPEVRELLRAALTKYRNHATHFTTAAAALAALGDSSAVGPIGDRLFEPTWSMLRPSLLDSLGRLGGEEAGRVLVAYLRDPRADLESTAVEALSRFDAASARAEAKALLDGTHGNPVTPAESERLRRLLER
jgi:hypothetical protein